MIFIVSIIFLIFIGTFVAPQKKNIELTPEEKLQSKVYGIIGFTGHSYKLSEFLKIKLNDPKSYKPIDTSYYVSPDEKLITIKHIFAAKNGFNATVKTEVKALFDLETGELLEILDYK